MAGSYILSSDLGFGWFPARITLLNLLKVPGLVKEDHTAALAYRQASQAMLGVPLKPCKTLLGSGLRSLTLNNNTLNR
jgi:hypothetical protein